MIETGSYSGSAPRHPTFCDTFRLRQMLDTALVSSSPGPNNSSGFFSKFRLNVPKEPCVVSALGLGNTSTTLFWDLAQAGSGLESVASSRGPSGTAVYGNFLYDSESGRYNMSWPSWTDFLCFLTNEEGFNSIELRKISSTTGAKHYLERIVYVCARAGSSGKKGYEQKHPDWSRKVPGKSTNCPCSLKVKKYHGTSIILGKYTSDHNHKTGVNNLCFTRISDGMRDWIAGMVRMKVRTDHIVIIYHVLVVLH